MRKSEGFSCRWDVRNRRLRPLRCLDNCSKVFFRPAVLSESSYATRIHNSLVGPDQMLVCEVALVQPHSGFPSVSQLRCRIPRSFSNLWKVSKHRFAELQQPSAIRTTHGSIKWSCTSFPLNRGMSQAACRTNSFHQCIVSGRSVLCSFLRRFQHRAHLSRNCF